MIKRLLLVLLLIGGSLAVLHYVIGFENFAKTEGGPQDEPIRRTRDERGLGGGVEVGGGTGDGPRVSVSGSGEFRELRREERALPDGSRIRLRTFELLAEDSETVAEDLVRLDRLTALLFQIDDSTTPPSEVEVGTIEARQAFLQVARDESGKPSIREDRDMDLRDVVLTSTAESEAPGLRFEVERVLVRQTDLGVEFRTPGSDVPFEVVFAGDGVPTRMRGRGVRGVLPSNAREPGSVFELHVDADPEVVHGSTTLRSSGRLDYVEDLSAGVGRLSLQQNVEVEGFPGGSLGDGPTTATGDRLGGTLVRGAEASWRRLVLSAEAPRRVVVSQGEKTLGCARLAVLPAIDGQPSALLAEGAPELIDATDPTRIRRVLAEHRIHLVDVRRFVGAPLSSFGFSAPPLARLLDGLAVFEGRSAIQEGGLRFEAADGLRVMAARDGSIGMARGFGKVRLDGDGLTAESGDGLRLFRSGTETRALLGQQGGSQDDRLAVSAETADGTLRAEGHGWLSMLRAEDGTTDVHIVSPKSDLDVRRGEDRLRDVANLDASVDEARKLRGLTAEGSPVRLSTVRASGRGAQTARVEAEANHIEAPDVRSLFLRGAARVFDPERGEAKGDEIEFHRTGTRAGIVIARGTAASMRASGAAGSWQLDGASIEVRPGMVPAALLRLHGVVPGLANPVFARQLATARGNVVFCGEGETEGSIEGRGDRLLAVPEARLARIVGEPALVQQRQGGRTTVATAADIRVAGEIGDRGTLTLLPATTVEGATPTLTPRLDVLGDGDGSSDAFRAFRLFCDVPIHIDEKGVKVDGPFAIRGLDADGEIDPDGIAVDAARLAATWESATRTIESIRAFGDARLRYRSIRAFGDEMRIDARETLVEVESQSTRPAGVVLRGRRIEGDLFRADYEAQELRAWGIRGGGSTPR
ncbi:MAG: hypothetical protein O3C51_04810 [Planctomycetota bacterium]|nr:hypothetical protein [Planctomycetota bacterium]